MAEAVLRDGFRQGQPGWRWLYGASLVSAAPFVVFVRRMTAAPAPATV